MILMFPLNAYIATQLRNYQIIQMKRKDERVKIMNETLSGIKVSAHKMLNCFRRCFMFL